MARGIAAAIFLIALVFSITILSTVGFYAAIGEDMDVSSQNQDIQDANESLSNVEYDEDRSSAILQGPLAAVIPAIEILQTLTTVVGNTSGVLQMLFGAPKIVGDMLELFFRLAMGITIVFLIRGAVQ